MRFGPILISVFLGLITLLVFSFTSEDEKFHESKSMIALRKVGHELLLDAGDKTSRVLPVKQLAPNSFRLTFSAPFHIKADRLVAIMDQTVKAQQLPPYYLVEIKKCSSTDVVYGFVVDADSTYNNIPCLERGLPTGCYMVDIRFSKSVSPVTSDKYYVAGAVAIIAVLSLFSWKSISSRRKATEPAEKADTTAPAIAQSAPSDLVAIGAFMFNADQQWLEREGLRIMLTGKEAKLLSILAASPNRIIERSLLQKQIWEDEGVIVSRSLDMFISKLRKKLDGDPQIRIVNVHGKGYKLEVLPA